MHRYVLIGTRTVTTADSKTEAENLRAYLVSLGESVRTFVYVRRAEVVANSGLFQEV